MVQRFVSGAIIASLAFVLAAVFVQTPWGLFRDALSLTLLSTVAAWVVYTLARSEFFRYPRTSFLWVGVPLLVAFLVSMANSTGVILTWGLPLGMGGVVGTIEFLVALYTGLFMPRRALGVFLHGFVAAAVMSGIAIALFGMQVVGIFSSNMWWSTAFVLVAGGLVSATLSDNASSPVQRSLLAGIAAVSLALFLLVRDTPMIVTGMIATALVIVAWFITRRSLRFGTLPYASVGYLVVLAVLLVSNVGPVIQALPPRDSAPLSIVGATAKAELSASPLNTLFGSGPSFGRVWNTYRPLDANMTKWWMLVPTVPNSDGLLIVMEYGAVGVYGFFLAPLLLAWMFLRKRESPDALADASFALSLFCFIGALLTGIDLSLVLCGALSAGGCAALVAREWRQPKMHRYARYAIAAVLFVATLTGVVTGAFASYAAFIHDRANEYAKTDPLKVSAFTSAANLWPDAVYLVDAGTVRLNYELARAQIAQSLGRQPDAAAIQDAIVNDNRLLNEAILQNPKSPYVWMSNATFYLFLDTQGVAGARQKSADALSQAVQLAPMRPDVRFDQAVIANRNGDTAAAKAYLKEALRLKPDYKDAQTLLDSLGG